MVIIPRKGSGISHSPYAMLGLTDLPFPTEPVVDPYNHDPRRNGTIYAESPVKREIEKFEQLLIRPGDFLNRVRLSYLWSKGDKESGRGMGKTALLRYFRQRINKDWGLSEFDGQFSAVVVYVAFPSQIDRRYMEQLAWSAIVDICKNGALDASLASLRLETLTQQQVDAVTTASDGTQNFGNLLNDPILKANDIDVADLNKKVAQRLTVEGVQPPIAVALAQGQFEDHLRSLRKDHNLEPFYIPRDTKNLDYSRTLLFNDMVHYLRSAGFAGGYLFIDDIENLVDLMTRKHRIEFTKEFGLCTVRPGYANTAFNFFSSVLTTHQQASVALSQAWGEAGLSTIARLDPTSPNSVELPLPSKDQAREILIAHLNYYRAHAADTGTIKPFTEAGISSLINKRQHPRDLLSIAAKVILHAVEKNLSSIDDGNVNEAMDSAAPSLIPDFSDGIDGAV